MATKDVLLRYAPIGAKILKDSVSKVSATGKTAESIRFVVDTVNLRLQYIGRGFFETLETFRGPRKSSAYGGLDQSMEDWAVAKGFPSREAKRKKLGGIATRYFKIGRSWMSGKSLAHLINKKGNKDYQGGKKVRDVYSDAKDKFIEELTKAVKDDKVKEFKNAVVNSLKQK